MLLLFCALLFTPNCTVCVCVCVCASVCVCVYDHGRGCRYPAVHVWLVVFTIFSIHLKGRHIPLYSIIKTECVIIIHLSHINYTSAMASRIKAIIAKLKRSTTIKKTKQKEISAMLEQNLYNIKWSFCVQWLPTLCHLCHKLSWSHTYNRPLWFSRRLLIKIIAPLLVVKVGHY